MISGVRKKLIVWLIILSSFFILHCSRDYPIFEQKDVKFPLSIGNWWKLSRKWKMVFNPPVSPWGDSIVLYYSIHWEIVDKDNLCGYQSYVLQNEYYEENEGYFYTLDWYTDFWGGRHGLYHIAYSGVGGLPIKFLTVPGYKFKFAGRTFNSPHEILLWIQGLEPCKEDTTLRIPPRKVLVYPLKIGKEWIAFDDPWLQTRKVVGRETIITPEGTFLCYKIEVVGEVWKDYMVWYDWFSNKGLIKRYIWFTGYMTDEHGNIIGTLESTDIYLLEGYFIH